MPKIRALKPDFWTDEAVVSVQPLARLLFQGLWNYACDNGHVQDKPFQIKMRILPADSCDVGALLDELADADLITRANGVVTVINLSVHQRPDKRFFVTCDIDGCSKPPRSDHHEPTSSPPRGTNGHSKGTPRDHDDDVDVDGVVDGDGDGDIEDAAQSTATKRGTRLPQGWKPSLELRKQMAEECPGVNLLAEHRKFVDHWNAKTGRDATKLDWPATWRNWIRNARPDLKNIGNRKQADTDQTFSQALAWAAEQDQQREAIGR